MFMSNNQQKQVIAHALPQAAQILEAGGVVGYPTETVWGLASKLEHVSLLYQRKGRHSDKAMQLSCAHAEIALALAQPHPVLTKLASFWPGPLTIVTPVQPKALPNQHLNQLAPNGMIGLRVPSHPIAQALLQQIKGQTLATTSLNPSGQPTARNMAEAKAYQLADYLLPDPQTSNAHQPSTVILLSTQPEHPVQVLRKGAFSIQQLRQCLAPINVAVQVANE